MRKKIMLCILTLSMLSFANNPLNVKLSIGALTIKNNGTNGGSTNSLSSLFRKPDIKEFKEGNLAIGLELESDKTKKFSNTLSFENNLGLESTVTFKNIKLNDPSTLIKLNSYKEKLYITNILYYQPALKLTIAKDYSIKLGLKVGTGLAMHKGNDVMKPAAAKPAETPDNWHFKHENVLGAILGLGIKNFLIETEFSDRLTIDWANSGIDNFIDFSKFKNIGQHTTSEYIAKVKLGYVFGK